MKGRAIRAWLAAFILCSGLALAAPRPAARPIRALCTTYPIYLFTRAVCQGSPGVAAELMLPSSLGCPHDYVMTPVDMRRLSEADLLVENGLGMEDFLEAPLRKARPRLGVVDSSAGISGLIRMSPEPGAAGGDHHHAGDFNPHLFASPRQAARIVGVLAENFARLDPARAALYRKNAALFAARMNRLADEFKAAAAAFPNKRIVTQHAVFDYLARDSGLSIVAVVEEEPGQAPSAAGMLSIVREIREKKAAAVFTEPQYPAGVGKTVAREAGIPVAVLDPAANGPANAEPSYYEAAMRENLETLKKVLGRR